MDFEQLMAQAAQVARAQDALLAEKVRRKRQEEEEKRRRQEALLREQKKAQKAFAAVREEEKQRQEMLLEQKRKQREVERQKDKEKKQIPVSVAGSRKQSQQQQKASTATETPVVKKKSADMSFDELMKKAKEVSMTTSTQVKKDPTSAPNGPEHSTASGKRPPSTVTPASNTRRTSDNTPNIYRKGVPIPKREEKKNPPKMSAREQVALLYRRPLTKLNTQKRDIRSVCDIQRDMMHAKGFYTDDEDDERDDPRLMKRKSAGDARLKPSPVRSSQVTRSVGSSQAARPAASSQTTRETTAVKRDVATVKRPVSTPSNVSKTSSASASSNIHKSSSASASSNLYKPSSASASSSVYKPSSAAPPVRRMPFGRPTALRRPMKRRSLDDEVDEDLRSFIVDDEDDEANDYSVEIGRIFRYDKRKYRDDIYSDDDMEADAREVLREERRSERIGRREDIEEEKRELERLKRRKLKAKERS